MNTRYQPLLPTTTRSIDPGISPSPSRLLFLYLFSAVAYAGIPVLLILVLPLHVQSKEFLSQLIEDPVGLRRLRALLWLSSSLLFLGRAIRTPRGESFVRLLLLLLVLFTMTAGFEAVQWGRLVPGFGFLSPATNDYTPGLSVVLELSDLSGFPAYIGICLFLGFYGAMLPYLCLGRLEQPQARMWLGQCIPVPRLSLWFLVAALLATGLLTPLGEQLGRLSLAILMFLVAITPREWRLQFAPPDSAVVVLFLIGATCFSVVIFEPQIRKAEEERIAKLRTEMINNVLSNNAEGLSEQLAQSDAPLALKTFPLVAEAATVGNNQLVLALLQRGANPNIPTSDGRFPIEIASEAGAADVVLTLLLNGANPNILSLNGNLALVEAIKSGHLSIVERLLTYGAEPDLPNLRGQLPVVEAARSDFFEALVVLHSSNADFEAKDSHGETALEVAPIESRSREFIVSQILKEGINTAAQAPVLIVEGTPSTVWSSDEQGETLVALALTIKNLSEIKAQGVDISLQVIAASDAVNDALEDTGNDNGADTKDEAKEPESQEADPLYLRGPAEIEAGASAEYFLNKKISQPKERLEIVGTCTGCTAVIRANLSELSKQTASSYVPMESPMEDSMEQTMEGNTFEEGATPERRTEYSFPEYPTPEEPVASDLLPREQIPTDPILNDPILSDPILNNPTLNDPILNDPGSGAPNTSSSPASNY